MWLFCLSYALRMAKLALNRILKARGISRREFARRMEVDRGTAYKYFRADYNPTLSTLNKIARAIKCRVRDLLADDR
jgi:transcriptional regulator with XRE-family HTH domain